MSKYFYTTDEIAEITQVTTATVREWVKAGALPAIRPGRSYLIRTEDFEKFLKEKHD